MGEIDFLPGIAADEEGLFGVTESEVAEAHYRLITGKPKSGTGVAAGSDGAGVARPSIRGNGVADAAIIAGGEDRGAVAGGFQGERIVDLDVSVGGCEWVLKDTSALDGDWAVTNDWGGG